MVLVAFAGEVGAGRQRRQGCQDHCGDRDEGSDHEGLVVSARFRERQLLQCCGFEIASQRDGIECGGDDEALGARVADPARLRPGDGGLDLAAVRPLHDPDWRGIRGSLPDALGDVVGSQGPARPPPDPVLVELGPLAARDADGVRDLRPTRLHHRHSVVGAAATLGDLQCHRVLQLSPGGILLLPTGAGVARGRGPRWRAAWISPGGGGGRRSAFHVCALPLRTCPGPHAHRGLRVDPALLLDAGAHAAPARAPLAPPGGAGAGRGQHRLLVSPAVLCGADAALSRLRRDLRTRGPHLADAAERPCSWARVTWPSCGHSSPP